MKFELMHYPSHNFDTDDARMYSEDTDIERAIRDNVPGGGSDWEVTVYSETSAKGIGPKGDMILASEICHAFGVNNEAEIDARAIENGAYGDWFVVGSK